MPSERYKIERVAAATARDIECATGWEKRCSANDNVEWLQRPTRIAAVSFIGALRFAFKAISGGPRMLEPGDVAPDFEAVDHHNRPVHLRDLRGKKVVLWFYPKADTPG
jgi:hypothetical protein